MNFAKLLLEQYFKLHEQPIGGTQGYIEVLTLANNMQPGMSQPQSPPQGGSEAVVGKSQEGNPYIKGGPFGSGTRSLNTLGDEEIITINNWWAGQEETGKDDGTAPEQAVPQQDSYDLDPVFSLLTEDDRERMRVLDQLLPGASAKLKSIYENSKGLVGTQVGRKKLSERVLLQKVLGGSSRGSLAYNLQKELEKGEDAIRFERSDFIGFAVDDDLKMISLSGSLETMEEFSKAFKNSQNCEQTNDDMTSIYSKVRTDGSGSYFFKNSYEENGFGLSLSLADENPINMMASQYNDNLDACYSTGSEVWHIPVKDIRANATGDSGNIGNMIKEASENLQIAAFYLAKGEQAKAKELILDVYSRFGEEAFRRLRLKRDVEAGNNILDESYQQMIDELGAFGIEASDDIKGVIRNNLHAYLISSAQFAQQINADYAVRVGGAAGKGDKSDVDYVMKQKPVNLPEGAVMHKVKFEDLAPEVRKEIGTPTQSEYFVIKDSLKTYANEGEVKVGTSNSVETEAARLLDDNDKHGSYVWNELGVDDKTKAEGRKVLEKMQKTSASLKKLLDKDFRTGTMPVGSVKKFVSKQIEGIAKDAGMDRNEIRALKKVLDGYQKGEDNRAVLGMLDREFMMLNLKKSMTYNDDGTINKSKSGGGLAAVAALQASMGIDSTGIRPQSTINILSTGNIYREDQNESIITPLKDLLDPESQRNVSIFSSKVTIDEDGAFELKAGKGKAQGNGYVNTNHLKKK